MIKSKKQERCQNLKGNINFCNCSYSGCERTGLCCECLQYHRKKNELPACFFPDKVERTYDRSFKNFTRTME